MKDFIHTNEDGTVTITTAAPKEKVERFTGPMTQEEFESFVINKSVPTNSTNVRKINPEDVPISREFRGAWCDVTAETRIDIDCEKARDLELGRFREKRNKLLEQSDKDYIMALSSGDTTLQTELLATKAALRDSTSPLKGLSVNGKINDDALLSQIRLEGEKDPASYVAAPTNGGGKK
jgi:hypothetical protein